MTRAGTTFVEVEVLTPGSLNDAAQALTTTQTIPAMSPVLYLQAGAFGVAANAAQLADRLRRSGFADVLVLPPDASAPMHRVRIGPIANVAGFDEVAARLTALGIDARLVTP
jgi:cell division septation protein DedD